MFIVSFPLPTVLTAVFFYYPYYRVEWPNEVNDGVRSVSFTRINTLGSFLSSADIAEFLSFMDEFFTNAVRFTNSYETSNTYFYGVMNERCILYMNYKLISNS